METLVINIKDKKDSKLIKKLLKRMSIAVTVIDEENGKKSKSKAKLEKDLSTKEPLLSKKRIQNLSWKKKR